VSDFSDHMPRVPRPNEHVLARLEGIQNMLMGAYQASHTLSSATKGSEREDFVEQFLSEVLPTPFRFGRGDVTDTFGNRSGQVDVVVEYTFLPSLPLVGGGERLYLAESVAAILEVKSDLSVQWPEVLATTERLQTLKPRYLGTTIQLPRTRPIPHLPLFAVGYKGWKQLETLESNLGKAGSGSVAALVGALVVEPPGMFVGLGFRVTGAWALWALICCIHEATSYVKERGTSPLDYLPFEKT
jgi:hypothetical protein